MRAAVIGDGSRLEGLTATLGHGVYSTATAVVRRMWRWLCDVVGAAGSAKPCRGGWGRSEQANRSCGPRAAQDGLHGIANRPREWRHGATIECNSKHMDVMDSRVYLQHSLCFRTCFCNNSALQSREEPFAATEISFAKLWRCSAPSRPSRCARPSPASHATPPPPLFAPRRLPCPDRFVSFVCFVRFVLLYDTQHALQPTLRYNRLIFGATRRPPCVRHPPQLKRSPTDPRPQLHRVSSCSPPSSQTQIASTGAMTEPEPSPYVPAMVSSCSLGLQLTRA